MQTIKAAQGDIDVNEALLPPPGETPGDAIIATEEDKGAFGIPAADDPDPFGVKALEEQGLFIREAGTHARPHREVFEFRPSPSSPVYSTFARRSLDSSRNSWRASIQSSKSHVSVDKGTQTDGLPPHTAASDSGASSRSVHDVPEVPDSNPWDIADTSEDRLGHDADDGDDEYEHGDVEIHEASNTTVITRPESVSSAVVTPVEDGPVLNSSPTFSRPRLVTIPKRNPPPALPPRNPERKHDSFSTQSSVPTSPSPTNSAHPEIRKSSESLRSDLTPNGVTEMTPSKIDSVVNDTHNHFHDSAYAVEKEEFHSIPTSPVSEARLELKTENAA